MVAHLFVALPITIFRQSLLRDFTHTSRIQIHNALLGLFQFGTHSCKSRHFILKRSRSLVP